MFVDELQISVRAGKGGDGCVSFLRDKNVQRGGPDGGDGGDGGSVILQPSTHVNTLYHLTGQGLFAAKNGDPGGSKDCYGKKAGDLVLEVPVGTMVVDIEHGNVLKDLIDPSEPFIIARGGFGETAGVRDGAIEGHDTAGPEQALAAIEDHLRRQRMIHHRRFHRTFPFSRI